MGYFNFLAISLIPQLTREKRCTKSFLPEMHFSKKNGCLRKRTMKFLKRSICSRPSCLYLFLQRRRTLEEGQEKSAASCFKKVPGSAYESSTSAFTFFETFTTATLPFSITFLLIILITRAGYLHTTKWALGFGCTSRCFI